MKPNDQKGIEIALSQAEDNGLIDPPSPEHIDPEVFQNHYRGILYQIKNLKVPPLDAVAQIPEEDRAYRRPTLERILQDLFGKPETSVAKIPESGINWLKEAPSGEKVLWTRFKTCLENKPGFDSSAIDSLDNSTELVLASCGDPRLSNELKKGLVIGYVQSGKTANYTGLIAKAIDAGYRIVIVMTGIHNNLRRQTQLRLESELGLSESIDSQTENETFLLTGSQLTGGDYAPRFPNQILEKVNGIFVIKKNVNILKQLIDWLPPNFAGPALIIDDEADQASINTNLNNRDEGAPSETNMYIRMLLKSFFKNRTYVGYTATPYANVFVDPKNQNDLFPEDFVVSLPKPKGYTGVSEFFGLGATASNCIRALPNEQADTLARSLLREHSSDFAFKKSDREEGKRFLDGLIREHVLNAAAFRKRSGPKAPVSMLIHVSKLTHHQETIKDLIFEVLNELRNLWRFDRLGTVESFKETWQIRRTGMKSQNHAFDFQEIEPLIDDLLSQFGTEVLSLNQESQDELDYSATPYLSAIVIGGDKLSRGLTLEGLLTSVFLRSSNSPKADTLSQMGRFFGYRESYLDLITIITSETLAADFAVVSELEENLRDELRLYQSSITPADFAPRVLNKMGLLPTSPNKMKLAKPTTTSYSGVRIQSVAFAGSEEIFRQSQGGETTLSVTQANMTATRELIDLCEDFRPHSRVSSALIGNKVLTSDLAEFIGKYRISEKSYQFSGQMLEIYLNYMAKQNEPKLHHWNLAVVGRSENPILGAENFGGFEIGRLERNPGDNLSDSPSIKTLTNRLASFYDYKGDEILDFEDEELSKFNSDLFTGKSASEAARLTRSQGLILIYPISPHTSSQKDSLGQRLFGDASVNDTIIGVSLVFPFVNDLGLKTYWQVGGK
jgi:hypothetical protein